MNLETTWGNQIILGIESELDNGHDLTTAEVARLMIKTLSLMVAEVRRENERELVVREDVSVVGEPPRQSHERTRLDQIEAGERDPRAVE